MKIKILYRVSKKSIAIDSLGSNYIWVVGIWKRYSDGGIVDN